jgi:hypothetical protein
MTSEGTKTPQPTVESDIVPDVEPAGTKTIYRFLGGAALGAFIVGVPMSYGGFFDLSAVQIGVSLLLIITCGILTSLWGTKFIDTVTQALGNIP